MNQPNQPVQTKRAKRKRFTKVAALFVSLAGAIGVGSACVSMPSDIGLQEGRLRPCPSSPNCVCSEGEDPSIAPLTYTGNGQAAFQSLIELIEAQPRVELVTVEQTYAHAVFRTPLMRFRDDLEVRLDEPNTVIHVRSASRVGHSDMGANRKRVEALRVLWAQPSKD
ncbi:MAG: hypothetical protein ACI9D0_001630 [Bacteroidia bacterium]|jgi:uncharacterized protein (DUF1499 family)